MMPSHRGLQVFAMLFCICWCVTRMLFYIKYNISMLICFHPACHCMFIHANTCNILRLAGENEEEHEGFVEHVGTRSSIQTIQSFLLALLALMLHSKLCNVIIFIIFSLYYHKTWSSFEWNGRVMIIMMIILNHYRDYLNLRLFSRSHRNKNALHFFAKYVNISFYFGVVGRCITSLPPTLFPNVWGGEKVLQER